MDQKDEVSIDEAGRSTNRRDLIKGAAGVAAAATVGGLLFTPQLAAAAPTTAPARLYATIEGAGGFKVNAMSWSGSLPMLNLQPGKPSLSAIYLNKPADNTSNQLVRAMLSGKSFPSGTITYADPATLVVQQAFDLTDIFVTKITMASGDEAFSEEIELNFKKITFVRINQSPVIYDLQAAKLG